MSRDIESRKTAEYEGAKGAIQASVTLLEFVNQLLIEYSVKTRTRKRTALNQRARTVEVCTNANTN